ncbi:MAG: YkoF family thiamine/hydroxymethylpyrimidine-binding protein [Caldisericaceae bacterium]
MLIEAQFSLYPVRVEHISPYIDRAVEIIKSFGLEVKVGPMSSITYGESSTIFKAFDKIIEEFGGKVQFVLITTISNACPVDFPKEATD